MKQTCWRGNKEKTYDLEESLLIIAGDGISVYFSLQPKWLTPLNVRYWIFVFHSMLDVHLFYVFFRVFVLSGMVP